MHKLARKSRTRWPKEGVAVDGPRRMPPLPAQEGGGAQGRCRAEGRCGAHGRGPSRGRGCGRRSCPPAEAATPDSTPT